MEEKSTERESMHRVFCVCVFVCVCARWGKEQGIC